MKMMKLTIPQRAHRRWGRADFFDDRRKAILIRIARFEPADVFYDLGCGDASLLIYVTKKCGLKSAVGFENIPSRVRRARQKIAQAGLQDRIFIENDMYGADLSKADVIFDMMSEGKGDYRGLYSRGAGIRSGTRLIKHDLPLIGFLPDKVELPFYLMRFPLRKAESQDQWASSVLGEPDGTVAKLWHELSYYYYEKRYSKGEILHFQVMLSRRLGR
jgi:hypothetical protein